MFSHLTAYPGDPILSLNEAFGADARTQKVNLGIGVYLEDDGRVPTMGVVKAAVEQLKPTNGPFPYLPMEGARRYRSAVQKLLFTQNNAALKSECIATVQTLGGSGALKVAADFLKTHLSDRKVYVSDPSWDNHRSIFQGAGWEVADYRYFDPSTGKVDFAGMQEAMWAMASGSVVILHACCHNPTGADLNQHQWGALADLVAERGLLPLVDIAYQGFGAGIHEDAYVLRALASRDITFLVANSFSKNFALYGERCGALSIVCATATQTELVLGQLKSTIRKNYSNPPTFGSSLIAEVLESKQLYTQWAAELAHMRGRILSMRKQLHALLCDAMQDHDFERLMFQSGMFSYTGLGVEQVRYLRSMYGVYLVETGRMCMAALSAHNVEYVAEAIVSTLKTVPNS